MSAIQVKELRTLHIAPADPTLPPATTKPLNPVQRYLAFAGVQHRVPIDSARVGLRGWLKSTPHGRSQFLPNTLELASAPWSRTSTATTRFGIVRDTYSGGEGRLRFDLLSSIPIRDVSGPEIAASELVALLAELPFMPTALSPSDRLIWSAIDDKSARATLRDGDIVVSGVFRMDECGRIWRFESVDRYCRIDNEYARALWQITYREYNEFAGLQIPMWVQAAWLFNGDRYQYADSTVTTLAFNPT